MHILHWNEFASGDEAFHVAGLSSSSPPSMEEHTHAGFAECFLVVSGRVRHLVNGAEQDLSAGQFVLMRPSDRHRFRPARNDPFSFRNVAFPSSVLDDLRRRYFPDGEWLADERGALPPVVTLRDAALERMELRIARLMSRPRRRIYIDLFLLEVLADPPEPARRGGPPLPDWLERACDALNDPAAFAEGIPALFRLAGRSPEHVTRELKRRTGETPTERVNRLRIEHAARRLLLSGENITDIAYGSGFESLSYFSALFKKRFGLAPRDYRKKNQAAVFAG